ncbi:protein-lysine N-methyltransferase EEF2KMT isoform X2 [Xylocopa sonorina]|uniref:protein-lysine N-methyltransferase EEF2KMT isoform X2 n=1 Tax=Xylocopa sonorina TaxID=1818115 RepID=UPI00403AC8A6
MNSNSLNENNIIRQFLSCTPINAINILISKESTNQFLNLENQKEILENTINNNLVRKYPVKRSYQRAFLKCLMNKIEEEDGEIHDDIYTTYCNLISSMPDESIHYRHFLIGHHCISIKESTNIISEGTTGLCSWQGAIELSNWCMKNKEKFSGKVILELGCGVGLTGLCIIKNCSPQQYIFTDCHKTVLDMVSENIKLNLLNNEKEVHSELKHNRLKLQLEYNSTNVQVIELDWKDIIKYINEEWIVPDIVIGADILYDEDSFHELILGLKAFLAFSNRYAIIAATIRNVDTISQFLHQLASPFFQRIYCSTVNNT